MVNIKLDTPQQLVWVTLSRYILHRDVHNPSLKGLAAVKDAVHDYKPHLVVLGGLQMLDTYPFTEEELDARYG